MQGSKNYTFKRSLLDETFDFEKNYFFKEVSTKQWGEIKDFIENFFKSGKSDEASLKNFFASYQVIKKGSHNLTALRKMVDEVAAAYKSGETFFDSYKAINDFICSEYMQAQPSLLQCHFFPSESNENFVINMLRTCKYSLDIAIFTITNDKIFAAIEEVWNAGVDVRVITDDECCKQLGSDIYKLAADGVPVKTDDSAQYHMHHKFAVIDEAVVITGSFNWTTQAVKNNQENILFIENEYLAKKYTEEYERLWKSFKTIIDIDDAKKKVAEERENRRKRYRK